MAKESVQQVAKSSDSPYQLNPLQTTQACKVLLKHIGEERARREADSTKPNLLTHGADEESDEESEDQQTPVWLILTTKKHIVDQKRLKPNKIPLPHAINTSANSTICLITADPQSTYTDLLASPDFPATLRPRIQKVISIANIKKQHSTFEARRQLLASYDIFLADDRIVTYLPGLLGKTFYKGGSKRPIPVSIAASRDRGADGKRIKLDPANGRAEKQKHKDETKEKGAASPEVVAREIEKALNSALVHLAPGTTTAIKVARSGMSAQEVAENVTAVTNGVIERFVTNKWRNVRAINIKGPATMSFPIYMADELWEDEADVLETKKTFGKKRKAGELDGADGPKTIEGTELSSRKRKAAETKKPTAAKHAKKKRKVELEGKMAAETQLRKESLKKQKAQALAEVA